MTTVLSTSTKNSDLVRTFFKFSNAPYVRPEQLDQYFAILQPVDLSELWGEWKGGYFYSGNNWTRLMDLPGMTWYGKRFTAPNRVDALIYQTLGVKYPVPIGKAYVRMRTFRGKESAAMTYRFLPVTDHFRKITDDILMGVMDAKLPGMDWLYFYLLRD